MTKHTAVITIKYFASLRERFGREEEEVSCHPGQTVSDLWHEVSGGENLPPNVLSAVNQEYVPPDHPITAGDEVAFFPPVTGG